ncbi:MAG: hypothetical protein WBB45_02410 [Cyclobacteriaceae bacterium]
MSGLKNKFSEVEQRLPVMTRTEDFPGYYNYDVSLIYTYNRELYGFRYRYMSTGSRISAADYTGFMVIDLTVIGQQGSFFALIPLSYNNRFRFDLLLEAGVIWTSIDEYFSSDVYGDLYEAESEFRERNTFAEVGPRFSYRISSGISINTFASYSLDLSDVVGRGMNDSDWTGLRAGVSTSIAIFDVR